MAPSTVRTDKASVVPKWICLIAQIYGYWPHPIAINTASPNSHQACPNVLRWQWSINAVLTYIICVYFHYETVFEPNITDTKRAIAITKMSFAFISTLSVLIAIRKRGPFLKLIEIIHIVDHEVKHHTKHSYFSSQSYGNISVGRRANLHRRAYKISSTLCMVIVWHHNFPAQFYVSQIDSTDWLRDPRQRACGTEKCLALAVLFVTPQRPIGADHFVHVFVGLHLHAIPSIESRLVDHTTGVTVVFTSIRNRHGSISDRSLAAAA